MLTRIILLRPKEDRFRTHHIAVDQLLYSPVNQLVFFNRLANSLQSFTQLSLVIQLVLLHIPRIRHTEKVAIDLSVDLRIGQKIIREYNLHVPLDLLAVALPITATCATIEGEGERALPG